MKTMMIDMDDVITDGKFLEYINDYLKTNYNIDDFTDYYYVQKLVGDNAGFWDYVSNKNFYQDAPLLDDCYEVLNKLNDKYDLYIVTTYLWNETRDISGINLMNKYNYLKEKLPFITPDKFIFTSNKRITNFDIRLDDKIGNLEGGSIKLLFTAWHNKSISDDELNASNIIRVNSWKDIERILIGE